MFSYRNLPTDCRIAYKETKEFVVSDGHLISQNIVCYAWECLELVNTVFNIYSLDNKIQLFLI